MKLRAVITTGTDDFGDSRCMLRTVNGHLDDTAQHLHAALGQSLNPSTYIHTPVRVYRSRTQRRNDYDFLAGEA